MSLDLWKRLWAVLCPAILVAFGPAIAGDFIWDDIYLIRDNVFVHEHRYLARAFTTDLWDVSRIPDGRFLHGYYRPLVVASYIVDWRWADGAPWVFHVTNIAVHTANVALSYSLGVRLLGDRTLAKVGSLVFALHPTRTESVSWISGRTDPLATLFVLLTLIAVERGLRGQRARWALIGVLTTTLAFLCKETAAALPVLALVFLPKSCTRDEKRWVVAAAAVATGLTAAYLLLRAHYLPVQVPAFRTTLGHGFVSVLHYAERAIFPWPQTFLYKMPRGPDGSFHFETWEIAAGAIVVATMIVYLVHQWRTCRLSFWLMIAAGASLGPLTNFTNTGSIFSTCDRFLYLPLLFATWSVLAAGSGPVSALFARRTGQLLGVGFLTVSASVSALRSLDLRSEEALWNAELSVEPSSPVALRARASCYAREGDIQAAIEDLQASFRPEALSFVTLARPPLNATAWVTLLSLRAQQLPDGASTALDQLGRNLASLLEGSTPPTDPAGLRIEWRPNPPAIAWTNKHGVDLVAASVAMITSRLEQPLASRRALDLVEDQFLGQMPNPLLLVLAEAREERFPEARRRIAYMRDHLEEMPILVTPSALDDLSRRVISAQELFARGRAASAESRGVLRAQAYANLTAYHRAINALKPSLSRATAPLMTQLLVSARRERDALALSAEVLGPERARATIDAIRVQLPKALRDIPPVDDSKAP